MFGILKTTLATLGIALSLSACVSVVPGTRTHFLDSQGEPVKVSLDEMRERLDMSLWQRDESPNVYYCYVDGREVMFTTDSSTFSIDHVRYDIEHPGVKRIGGQVMIPLGAYTDVCNALGRKDAYISQFDPVARREAWEKEKKLRASRGPCANLTIVLDAGHGGKDPGAVGIEEVNEKAIVLDVALRVRDMLVAKGAKVITTRDSDTFVDLSERADIANRNNADLFVSIHANAFTKASANGIETLYRSEGERGEASKALATAINGTLVTLTGATDRGVFADVRDLRVLKNTTMPAALVEVGFTTNPEESAKLRSESYRATLAKGIAEGVTRYWTASKVSVSR